MALMGGGFSSSILVVLTVLLDSAARRFREIFNVKYK